MFSEHEVHLFFTIACYIHTYLPSKNLIILTVVIHSTDFVHSTSFPGFIPRSFLLLQLRAKGPRGNLRSTTSSKALASFNSHPFQSERSISRSFNQETYPVPSTRKTNVFGLNAISHQPSPINMTFTVSIFMVKPATVGSMSLTTRKESETILSGTMVSVAPPAAEVDRVICVCFSDAHIELANQLSCPVICRAATKDTHQTLGQSCPCPAEVKTKRNSLPLICSPKT